MYYHVFINILCLDDIFIPPPPPLINAAPQPPPPPQMESLKINKHTEAEPDNRSALLDAIRSGTTLKVS